MSSRAERQVRRYLSQGAQIFTQRNSEIMVLQSSGRKRLVLKDNKGILSNAGKVWEKLTGRSLPEGGYLNQPITRKANTEYIKLRSGKRVISRRFDGEEWRFTKAGKQYKD